jgi:16S rRNA (cytosine967-C5)-methyltransferase
VVEAILGEKKFTAAFRVLSIEPLLDDSRENGILHGPLEGAVRGNYLRTLPGVHPGDGFFAALIERVP